MTNNHNAQAVSRRRFLAATGGATLALPWLESLTRHCAAEEGPAARPAQRLAFFYLPNGITRRGFFPGEGDRPLPNFAGQNNVWRFEGKTVPPGSHPLTFTPTLAPLHKMRDKVSLITGLDRTFQHGTDSHAQAASCFLTSAAPFAVKNSAYPLARTGRHDRQSDGWRRPDACGAQKRCAECAVSSQKHAGTT